jgi:hypothetical protein
MRASSRIWSSMTNIHPTNIHSTDDPNSIEQTDRSSTVDCQPADDPNPNPGSTRVSDPQASSFVYPSSFGQAQREALVEGYARLITDRLDLGWSCYLVTFLFNQLPGPRIAVIDRIKDEVQRVYSTLLTRVHRKPKTASTDELPVLVGALDLQVYKRDRSSISNAFSNGGLHFHALVLMPPVSRLKGSLADHFRSNPELYAGQAKSVQRIHVEPVTHDPDRVVDYVFKTVFRGRVSHDDAILVLPRARSELPLRALASSGREQAA